MAAAVRFFVDVLGCEECFTVGPFAASDDWMERQIGVDPRTTIPEIRMLRCGNGPNLELFVFEAADQSHVRPRNSDYAGHHLSFYVDDMASAVSDLRARGIEVLGEPVVMSDGPSAGLTWVYFLAPWGLQLELVSYPERLAFETPDHRVWTPSSSPTEPPRP